jgi:hypothetical protein
MTAILGCMLHGMHVTWNACYMEHACAVAVVLTTCHTHLRAPYALFRDKGANSVCFQCRSKSLFCSCQ